MKILKIIGTITILCAIIFLAVGCSSKPTTTVKTQNVTVQKGSISVAVTGTGNLALSRTEEMAFEMAGYVEAVLVTEGETVKKGQQLAKLDTTEWDKQLKKYAQTLTTAQRTLSSKQQALTTAQRLVTTKESAVTAAQRIVDSKKLAVSQAELNIASANSTLNQIAEVKKAKDAVDDATMYLKMVNMSLAGGSDTAYWATQKINAQNNLAQAQEYYRDVVSGVSTTISSDVALQVAQKSFAVTQAQYALDDAQIAVNDALTAVETAQQALDDAKLAVTNAQLDINEAAATVIDAQSDLNDANSKSPIITATFDGFITKINVTGGDEVYKGTVAMVIADPDQFSAKISVTEDDIASVKVGSSATVTITSLSVNLPAKVTKISPTATVSSGVVSYSVTVNITSLQPITTTTSSQLPALSANRTMPSGTPSGNFTMPTTVPKPTTSTAAAATSTVNVTLKDGLSATVEIVSQQKDNILIILSKAITTKNQVSTVQVVTTGTATETRTVTTGITDGTYTEITAGLSEGEQVVIKSSSSSTTSTTTNTGPQIGIQGPGGGVGPPPGGF